VNENICLQELFADEVFAEICFGTFKAALTVEDLALESALVSDSGIEV